MCKKTAGRGVRIQYDTIPANEGMYLVTVGEHTYSVILYVHILGLGDRVDTACLFALLRRRNQKE